MRGHSARVGTPTVHLEIILVGLLLITRVDSYRRVTLMPTLLANACSEDNADLCSDVCQTLSIPEGGHDGTVISHIRCHVQVWNMALGVTDIPFPDTCLPSPPWLSSLVLGISHLLLQLSVSP